MTAAVRIAEVFPRDGLQTLLYEPGLRQPTTAEKIDFIVTGFGTLQGFLDINRAHLEEIAAAPPGQSEGKR